MTVLRLDGVDVSIERQPVLRASGRELQVGPNGPHKCAFI